MTTERLTRAVVLKALEQDPVIDDAGVHCQICDRAFPTKANLGVHQLNHRRVVGLAPRYPEGNRGRAPASVMCRYNGCREVLKRTSLHAHLRGRHGMNKYEASFYCQKRRNEEAGPPLSSLPVRVAEFETGGQPTNAELEPEPVSVLSDLHAVEAITGIMRIARTDGLIPAQLLPDIYELIQHTETVLHRLSVLSQ